ncbi:hypothetical protein OZ401_005045 (plasmid) [Candidatus Chlorohelix allophototropha]|uniref:VWFA domain-containing protein n=1 Tax=Candidatus Chlorohelix allophototropha TaxID=3003348 RepID=A0ABY9BAW1_9CHLR|nr:hypothetical protein OZ401_005045 [Chloroflexota bacterium L227-S17]
MILEVQIAGYGFLNAPPHLQIQLEEKRKDVARLESLLLTEESKSAIGKRKWALLIVSIISIVAFSSFIIVILITLPEKRTVYMMVDASDKMTTTLPQIRPRINLTTMSIPDGVDVGFAVFGGGFGTGGNCKDVSQLVPPSPKQDGIPLISKAVDSLIDLKPTGFGNLQYAATYALAQLAGRQGLQQILIITSSIDIRCGIPDRSEIENAASQKGISKLEIRVIAVGSVTEQEELILGKFTNNEYYILGSASELSSTIENVLKYPDFYYEHQRSTIKA